MQDTLSEVVSKAGLRQAKIVESEKAVHIRYFLNGKREAAYPGEERIVIESARDVEDFDETLMRARDWLELRDTGELSLERFLVFKRTSVDDFDCSIAAGQVAGQPNLAIGPAPNRPDQDVIGNSGCLQGRLEFGV